MSDASFGELSALVADADFIGVTVVQNLAEIKLSSFEWLQTDPLRYSDIVPVAHTGLIRNLQRLLDNKPQYYHLEGRYAKRVVEFSTFTKAVEARVAFLTKLQTLLESTGDKNEHLSL